MPRPDSEEAAKHLSRYETMQKLARILGLALFILAPLFGVVMLITLFFFPSTVTSFTESSAFLWILGTGVAVAAFVLVIGSLSESKLGRMEKRGDITLMYQEVETQWLGAVADYGYLPFSISDEKTKNMLWQIATHEDVQVYLHLRFRRGIPEERLKDSLGEVAHERARWFLESGEHEAKRPGE